MSLDDKIYVAYNGLLANTFFFPKFSPFQKQSIDIFKLYEVID